MASLAHSQIHERQRQDRDGDRRQDSVDTSYQMSVPNELIGSVIGKGGSKIAEIRQMSGAMIRISKSDDPNASPSTERQIMITGNADSVALAKSLINMSLDLHKASLERNKVSDDEEDGGSDSSSTPVRSRVSRVSRDDRPTERHVSRYYADSMGGAGEAGLSGLANLLSKPDVLAAVNILGQLSNIGAGSGAGLINQVGGGYRGGRSSYSGGSTRGGSREDSDRHRDNKRNKFAPY